MRRRAAVLAALLAALLLPVPGASAAAPEAQAWWNALHREGLPAPPAPPGVDPGELLVQGGDLTTLLPGLPAAQPRPLAVAALRFTVGPDDTVTSLELPVDGPAVAQDVRAYAAAGPFEPVENGPYEKAPDVVLDDFSQGVLSADGTVLSFPDVARLVGADGVLSVVLIAGPGDRVVLLPPGSDVLAVTTSGSPAAAWEDSGSVDPPAFDAPAGPLALDGAAAAPTTSSAFAPPPPVVPPPALPGSAGGEAPQVAAPGAERVVQAAGSPVDDTRTRVLLLLQALLLGLFFGLLGYGPFAQLSRYTGLTTLPRDAAAVRGIGRFSQLRSGKAPRL